MIATFEKAFLYSFIDEVSGARKPRSKNLICKLWICVVNKVSEYLKLQKSTNFYPCHYVTFQQIHNHRKIYVRSPQCQVGH